MSGDRRPIPPSCFSNTLAVSAHPSSSVSAVVERAAYCLGTTQCRSCDLCRLLCPDLAIARDSATGDIDIDLDYCKGCGICATVCPKGAITMVVESADD